jgi:hypothetical protein
MMRPLLAVLTGGASSACGLAAVGLALYGQGPSALAAASLFGVVGFVAGLVCGSLHLAMQRQPSHPQAPAALPPQALADLVRATLASAAAERSPRAGSAADRRGGPGAHATVDPAPRPAQAAQPAEAPAVRDTARQFASSAFGA